MFYLYYGHDDLIWRWLRIILVQFLISKALPKHRVHIYDDSASIHPHLHHPKRSCIG